MLPETLEWMGDFVRIVDQRELPDRTAFIDCRTVGEVAAAIRTLAVRGAPAIGVAAAYGAVIGSIENRRDLPRYLDELAATRPTAVNLFWAIERMKKIAAEYEALDDEAFTLRLLEEAKGIHCDDIENCRRIGMYGAALLPLESTVLTHCNAGALATGGYGTALGVIRAAREAGKKIRVYADETRPLLQGARLTAWELWCDDFDVTLITDGMAPALMRSRRIDAVIVGADRIATNGDTANKIGTYGLAVAASHHNIPFIVAAPTSTLDLSIENGCDIPIEERDGDEVRSLSGGKKVPDDIKVWNPAFDVTPAWLITAIVTERGIFKQPYDFREAFRGKAEQ